MSRLAAFLKPIAHRGLHEAGAQRVENTLPAFEAALARGYGIECDVCAAACKTPVVFHDDTLERLTRGTGPVADHDAATLKAMRFRSGAAAMPDLSELLALVAGRQPLLVEIKSDWSPPDRAFLHNVAALLTAYDGPLAVMSFDPAVVAVMRELAAGVPRGIVSGRIDEDEDWRGALGPERAHALTHLLESRAAAPDFYAYQADALPTPVTRYVREVQALPLFAWTVRSAGDWNRAARWADAPIFEGYEP
jgi:glycerophosphoryl diester phosphodiesterase